MKNSVDWVSCSVGSLCLFLLLILWILWWGKPQSSFLMFIIREVIIFVFWALALVFSLWGFRKRPFKLKLLNITTMVLASILGFLASFPLL